jgi:cytochrome P450
VPTTQETPHLESFRSTADGELFEYYARLRDEGAAVWDEGMNALLIGSYDLVRSTLQQDGRTLRWPRSDHLKEDPVVLALTHTPRAISSLHGEAHKRFHLWWLRAFSRSNVERWRATRIRPVVHAAIDRFGEGGRAELVTEFAEVVPIRAIASVLGLPWQDDDFLAKCGTYMRTRSEYRDACVRRRADVDEVGERATAVAREFIGLLRPIAEDRRSAARGR